ncbi:MULTISPECIES: ABC transporter ATP-binding protein [Maritimibacter]|uniref:Putative branched-chain amino acid uptake ABC transporter ATP-binding protein n=1 Tax=Maritimibacter alkaliphilus HTCC2654 TaxID=314271 RepID=A3VG60_9RHOB|nr:MULTISPECIES: ABC transporter ATP-binding protein [Maritimibacter]EAQ12836.1 putative branched-chain amino acid uptake ABC transporter ATP-binding protein [Rhodobacterales bacterium HTCC2654] [Maritimibacter alkaliphilus HTCC2654]MBL6429012.1 ABC transporter ATP-binding protein [Maritimibacter sp.]TYP85771.1 amino acid/amide ABC transporter ATP-binding protein 1 (HAAT family) [Maritimibacter alkaliphilus HTCC2654]
MTTGLQVRGLQKRFGGIVVADDINVDLPSGARVALIGPNGAGKTTFSSLITGKLTPSAGEITLDGRDIRPMGEAERVRAGIAKTFQITTLFRDLTVRDNLRLAAQERDGRARAWFRRADSWADVEDEIAAQLAAFRLAPLGDKRVSDLAYGQQRLVEMAMTLMLKPRVLILDEPAAGVPSSDSHLITDAIERLPDDLAVLIIEHDMKLVFRVARSIIVLVNGRILTQGAPEDIAADQRVRDLYLGAHHG